MLELDKKVWMAYGLDANTHHVLAYLCHRTDHRANKKLWDKAEIAMVTLSYDVIQFRCSIGKNTLVRCVAELRKLGIIKTTKKGPHEYFRFIIYGKKIDALSRTWEMEKSLNKEKWFKRGRLTDREILEYYDEIGPDETEPGNLTKPNHSSVIQRFTFDTSGVLKQTAGVLKQTAGFLKQTAGSWKVNRWNIENCVDQRDYIGLTEIRQNFPGLFLSGLAFNGVKDAGASKGSVGRFSASESPLEIKVKDTGETPETPERQQPNQIKPVRKHPLPVEECLLHDAPDPRCFACREWEESQRVSV